VTLSERDQVDFRVEPRARSDGSGLKAINDEDDQVARAVNSFDAAEFDIGCR
jgi:hypothetical protein